jgi:hypothetical protein
MVTRRDETLLKDVKMVLEGFDKGIFVRDISHDHQSDWAIRAFPYLAALGRLAEQVDAEAT